MVHPSVIAAYKMAMAFTVKCLEEERSLWIMVASPSITTVISMK